MSELKETLGTLSVSLRVDCPHCDNCIWDSYECQDQFEEAQEERGAFEAEGEFTCPECKKDFYVTGFEYV